MKIQFKLDYDFSIYPAKFKRMLISYRWVVAGRLSEIYEELALEESKGECGIVINFSDIDEKFQIGHFGYSKETVNKISSLLDEKFGLFTTSIIKML